MNDIMTEGGISPPLKERARDLILEFRKFCEAKIMPLLVQNEEHMGEMHLFNQGLLPPSVYLGRH